MNRPWSILTVTIVALFFVFTFPFCGKADKTATTTAAKAQPKREKLLQSTLPAPKTNVGIEAKMHEIDKKEHISVEKKRCAEFKRRLYASGLDKEQKDLIWGAVLVSSEYCQGVDTQNFRAICGMTLKPQK